MARTFNSTYSQALANNSLAGGLAGTNKATLSCWLKRAASNSTIGVGSWYGNRDYSFMVFLVSNGTFWGTYGNGNFDHHCGCAYTSTDWTHVFYVYDASQSGPNRIKVWLNNSAQTLTVTGDPPDVLSVNLTLWDLGRHGTDYHNGSVALVGLWKGVAMGATECAQLYNGTPVADIALNGGTLVGNWKLDETSGNAADSSGNSNTLTAVGAPTFDTDPVGTPVASESVLHLLNRRIITAPRSRARRIGV